MEEPVAFIIVRAWGVGCNYVAFIVDVASIEEFEVFIAEFTAIGEETLDVVQVADLVGKVDVLVVGHVGLPEDEDAILECL